jgi:hypothetical protein
MPSSSEKQRKFFGAQLAAKRAGKPTKTKMSETQLSDFAGSVGSLEDIDFHENAAESDVICDNFIHPVHKGYEYFTPGALDPPRMDSDAAAQFTKGSQSCNRDAGQGLNYGAPVEYFGPDTTYRAEEINPHHYGRDYEPSPLKDYFKTGDKAEEVGLRLREEYKYSEIATPGTVPDKGMDHTQAYGSRSYELVPTDLDDNRSFKSQQRFRRAQDEIEDDTVKVTKVDTKWGKNIR